MFADEFLPWEIMTTQQLLHASFHMCEILEHASWYSKKTQSEKRSRRGVWYYCSTHVVQVLLLGGVHPDHHGAEDLVNVLHGLEDPLAVVAGAAVAELARL